LNFFENRGFRVKIENQTIWELLEEADTDVMHNKNLPPEERELSEILSKNPRGQLLSTNFDDIATTVKLLSELHHASKIMVVVKNKDAVKSIFHRLCEIVKKHRVLDTRKKFRSHLPTIVVTTRTSFEGGSGDPFHFVLFADVESALSVDKELLLENWGNCAWYSIRNPVVKLHLREKFELKAVFGPILFDFKNDSRSNNFRVRFENIVAIPHIAKLHGLNRKRFLYWHCESWNKKVAKNALKYSLDNSVSLGEGMKTQIRETKTVSIMVESPEHAEKLSALLPGWIVKRNDKQTSAIPHLADKQIGTVSYAARWGFAVDVLVRADGGAGWPFPQNFFAGYHNESSEVLLVDFFDARDRTALRDTWSRICDYESCGWKIGGLEGSQGFHHDEFLCGGEESHLKTVETNHCPDILTGIHISKSC